MDLVFDEDSEADSTQMMDAIEVVLQEGDNTLKNSSIGTIKLKNDSIVIDRKLIIKMKVVRSIRW